MISKKSILKDKDTGHLTSNDLAMQIRLLKWRDLRFTKKLKNENRNYFFYKEKLTWKTHLKWYYKYMKTSDNFFFIIEFGKDKYGTIGIRFRDGYWDIYSVSRNKSVTYQKDLMFNAMLKITSFFDQSHIFRCLVLINNPALFWYKKIGFVVNREFCNYSELHFQQSQT